MTREAPLFIIGAPRSGTSLVYRALCLNPSASYVSNWLRKYPRLPALSLLNRIPSRLPSLQARLWFGEDSNAYRYGRRRALLERVFPAPVEGESVFGGSGVGEAEAPPPSARQVASLSQAFAAIRRFGGGVVVSKRISNNRRIPFLASVFPEARFVSIVRDGRAVAYSLSRVDWWEEGTVWWFGGTPADWRAAGHDPWELCARTWVEEVRVIEEGLAALPADRVLKVTYEDLVADPIKQLQAIAAFGGLTPSERWVESLRALSYPNRNEGWRTALEPEVVGRIEEFEGEELRRYGYV